MGFRVLTAELAHETNTFSRIATDEQAFRNREFFIGQEAIDARGQKNTELAGFLDAARRHDWQVDHVLSATAGPSGKVTRAAFDWLVDPIIAQARQQNYDGILLGLHGAMVTDFCEDGEAELLQRLRDCIGDQIPVAITLDLHANVGASMCALANIIVSYKTYPHIDMREAGLHAGEILQRAMTAEINPKMIRVDCPMLEEVNGGRTDIGPMITRIEAARQWESRDDAFAVSINAGFASADVLEAGPTVLVCAQGDMEIHRQFAQGMIDEIWNSRDDVLNDYLDVDDAALIASQFDAASGPLVIADYADNPGAGSYGDSTALLGALLRAKIDNACFGPMVDGEAVRQLQSCEPGAGIKIQLGGKREPGMGGGPLELEVELLRLSDGRYTGTGKMIGGLQRSFGASAVIRCEGIEILVTTLSQQMLDLQQFRAFGIEPADKTVVALKSMQHFRADFEPIAARVIVCDSGALCTPDYQRLNYQNVRRPIFPLEQDF